MGNKLSETTIDEIREEALELHYMLEDYSLKKELLKETQWELTDILKALDRLGYKEEVFKEVEKIREEIPF